MIYPSYLPKDTIFKKFRSKKLDTIRHHVQRRANLHFLSMLTDDLHQPGQQVGDSVGRDGLPEGSKHLKGTSGIVAR